MGQREIYVIHAPYTNITRKGNAVSVVSTSTVRYLQRSGPHTEMFNDLLDRIMRDESNDLDKVVGRLVNEHGFNQLEGLTTVERNRAYAVVRTIKNRVYAR